MSCILVQILIRVNMGEIMGGEVALDDSFSLFFRRFTPSKFIVKINFIYTQDFLL
jgi:hypothetical protein